MSSHSEMRDLRSEGVHFENKYKFLILESTAMPQIKEAFVWYNVNTTSTLQYPSEFCSDVSFTGTIFSINWHLLFVLTLLISDLTFIFLLVSLLVSVQPDIWKIFFRIMSENNSLHKTTVHTKQLFTQNNCSHKTTVHTKQLFTQNNCSHKTTVHTKMCYQLSNIFGEPIE